MQLSDWLKLANLSQKGFAEKLGISPAAVSRLVNSSRGPSITMMDQIERETNGAVRYEDWKQRVVKKRTTVKPKEGVNGSAQ